MSFLKSILLGSEGSYNLFGTSIKFQNELPPYLNPPSLDGAGVISRLAVKCINSNAFRWITQAYTHVFVHEMSHVIVRKALTGQNSKVNFFTNLCTGFTSLCTGKNGDPSAITYASNWKDTVIDVAGPMGNIAFSTCKLVAATALKNYLSWPVALALGSGAVVWMSGELLYAYVSAANKDHGDFGKIASRGHTHLALASTALASQCALGIFAAIKRAA